MTGTVIMADGLSVKVVAVAAQAGGTLNIGPNSKILGLTAGTFGVVSNAGSGASLIDVATNTGTVWSVGALNLRDNVRVNGDAHSAGAITLGNGTAVTGTRTGNTPISTSTITITVTFPATTEDHTVTDGKDLSLAPGSYRDVTVNTGGLVLRAGNYFFNSLTLNSGTRFKVDTSAGSVFVYVQAGFIYRPTQSAVAGNLNALRIVCFAATDVAIETAFTGTVVVPNATLRLQSNAPLSGGFFGKGLFAQAGTTVTQNGFPSWEPQTPPPSPPPPRRRLRPAPPSPPPPPPPPPPPSPPPRHRRRHHHHRRRHPAADRVIPRLVPTPSVPPKCAGPEKPIGSPTPPPGQPDNPWRIQQVLFRACRYEPIGNRKDNYLPYLVVRANPADHGNRPLLPGRSSGRARTSS